MTHRDFDGSQRLFQIGLKPLDPANWIDVDARLADDLAEKARIEAEHPDEVWAAEPGTGNAQAEVLALLLAHLPARYPDHYRRDGDALLVDGRRVILDGDAPLRIAARLVQEDLVLMRKGAADWRLAAASLCFPSSWHLREKFGRPIHEVHAPVPGFGTGTRNGDLIARMFDNLRPETGMVRWNWSIYPDGALYHPPSGEPHLRFGDAAFLRAERQTLRRLPQSRDILFTIRIYAEPLEQVARQENAATIATGLIAQLQTLDAEQLAYKGLTEARDEVIGRLVALT